MEHFRSSHVIHMLRTWHKDTSRLSCVHKTLTTATLVSPRARLLHNYTVTL